MTTLIEQIRSNLETNLTGRGITKFFKGNMDIPAKGDLPVVCVYSIEQRTERRGTVRDDVEYDIGIRVILDKRQYYNNSTGQGDNLKAEEALEKIFQERETDGDLKTNTIHGIMNADIKLGNNVLYWTGWNLGETEELPDAPHLISRTATLTAYDRPNRT